MSENRRAVEKARTPFNGKDLAMILRAIPVTRTRILLPGI